MAEHYAFENSDDQEKTVKELQETFTKGWCDSIC